MREVNKKAIIESIQKRLTAVNESRAKSSPIGLLAIALGAAALIFIEQTQNSNRKPKTKTPEPTSGVSRGRF